MIGALQVLERVLTVANVGDNGEDMSIARPMMDATAQPAAGTTRAVTAKGRQDDVQNKLQPLFFGCALFFCLWGSLPLSSDTLWPSTMPEHPKQ